MLTSYLEVIVTVSYASPLHIYQVSKEVLSSISIVGDRGRAVRSHPILSL